MEKALLIPVKDCNINEWFWVWSTANEKDLTKFYKNKQEAIDNRPTGYMCCDDGQEPLLGVI